ncbi:MAG TPA: UDP-N-acetylglucosamine 1-carboxyvinyltransferase [Dehalococcoidia bacterium]|nr:UDP-N-acetylglucosamine 1-carboxyvinyltransferase [Dehalococcoidia bacterium]
MPTDRLVVEGGRRLEGSVRVSGNKNAAIHALAATLLTSDDCHLENVPAIGDVRFMVEILRSLGATVEYTSPSSLRVNAAGVNILVAPSELATHLRGSFLVMGPLLTRFGEAACCPPGGDIIGLRPLNVHLAGFRVLDATVNHEGDKFVARTKGLRGSRIFLDYPSVLGTQNLMLAATLAEGRTTLVNAAAEPEIESLVDMLTQMGARISGAGWHTIEIEGVRELHGARHRIIPDRIEAGTFAIAAAVTQGDVEIQEGVPQQLDALLWKLDEAGVKVEETDGLLRVRGNGSLRAINAQAVPYPGLATDLQAPLATLLTQAKGVSSIYERVFENRLLYVAELRKMGAEVITSGTTVIISGPTPLYAANVRAVDLRAGAALALAALAADGRSEINDIFHLDRGYERFDEKLRSLGGRVERLPAAVHEENRLEGGSC